MRALSLWLSGEGIERAFADVFELMEHCRFRDCKHDQEPGCAVRAAIEDGRLDPDRFASLERLVAEEAALEEEQRAKEKAGDRRRGGRPSPTAEESADAESDDRRTLDGADGHATPTVVRRRLVGDDAADVDDGGDVDRAVDVRELIAGADEVLDDDRAREPVGVDAQHARPRRGRRRTAPAVAATCSANEQWM